MRLLFTCLGAAGHFHPLVEIARRAATAGHEVAFATGAAFCPRVASAGFPVFAAGFDYAGKPLHAWFPELHALTGDAYVRFVAGHIRVRVQAAQMVPDLVRLARSTYRPDLIVRDASEYGACVAAEILDIPHASIRTGRTPSAYGRRFLIQDELADLRSLYSLPRDPDVRMPFRYLHKACEPPGWTPPDEALAPTGFLLRPAIFDGFAKEDPFAWTSRLPAQPMVCATLGTFMNSSTNVFGSILDALRDEPLNLLMLVGDDVDPRQLSPGPQPEHVRIARYVPLSQVLPRCDLVISHAGFSTLATTLANGLPSVLIPLGADQLENAEAAVRLGVGRALWAHERHPEAIRDAARSMRADGGYRANAERLREAMLRLPGPEHAVRLLERLAQTGQPLTSC